MVVGPGLILVVCPGLILVVGPVPILVVGPQRKIGKEREKIKVDR